MDGATLTLTALLEVGLIAAWIYERCLEAARTAHQIAEELALAEPAMAAAAASPVLETHSPRQPNRD